MKKRILSILICAVMLLALLPATALAMEEETVFTGTEENVVWAAPGGKTVKNYLLNAMQPVGTVLYVWGGGWNNATTIGVPSAMINWYNSQSSDYDYHNWNDLSVANRAKGFDCSGFVGWCAYQALHSVSGQGSGYTCVSRTVGSTYQDRGWGNIIDKNTLPSNGYQLKAGDVGYYDSHTFIVVGQCRDKSLVIVHSTPQAGVQIAGTPTPDGKYGSQAAALAAQYMSRYPGTQKYEYLNKTGNYLTRCSFFRWNRATLADPDGYMNKYADEILADLFATIDGTNTEPVEPIEPPEGVPFTDVSKDAWYAGDVVYVYQSGFMSGTSGTKFEPNASMTRAMFATVLYRVAGQPEVTGANPFHDVQAGSWYEKAVTWASRNGITTGTSYTTFEPQTPVTREQMAVFLYRYATMDGSEPSIADLSLFAGGHAVSSWAAEAMGWALSAGIIQGNGEDLLPQKPGSRAQFAAMLQRYFQWTVEQ